MNYNQDFKMKKNLKHVQELLSSTFLVLRDIPVKIQFLKEDKQRWEKIKNYKKLFHKLIENFKIRLMGSEALCNLELYQG